MKILTKTIVVLFFIGVAYMYVFIPAALYLEDDLMPKIVPLHTALFVVSHVIIGAAIAIIPIIYIISWIDKNFKETENEKKSS